MSCVDAAIIKALVEHIGGNPDDVVVGGGASSMIPATWSIENIESKDHISFTLPAGAEIKVGTCLLLKAKGDVASYGTIKYYCTLVGRENDMPAYQFTAKLDSFADIMVFYMGNRYVFSNQYRDEYELPDNKNGGLLAFESTAADCARVILDFLPNWLQKTTN